MIKNRTTHSNVKKMLLEDKEVKKEYDALEPRYEAISAVIRARKEQNITQAQLAASIGTTRSNISRFENGNQNPSVDFLTKIAGDLGKKVHIEII